MNIIIYRLSRIIPAITHIFYLYWNRFKFRMLGIQYGNNLRVINKIYVKGYGSIIIGDDFRFTSGDCINPICRNIKGGIYLGSKNASIEIGDRVGISSACLWANTKIIIGNDVNIGGDTLIFDNDAHPVDYIQRRINYFKETGLKKEIPSSQVKIDDDVWVGARCIILKGVHIGARSIIAAGSVVTKDIPSDVLAGGDPCRVIKSIK